MRRAKYLIESLLLDSLYDEKRSQSDLLELFAASQVVCEDEDDT